MLKKLITSIMLVFVNTYILLQNSTNQRYLYIYMWLLSLENHRNDVPRLINMHDMISCFLLEMYCTRCPHKKRDVNNFNILICCHCILYDNNRHVFIKYNI